MRIAIPLSFNLRDSPFGSPLVFSFRETLQSPVFQQYICLRVSPPDERHQKVSPSALGLAESLLLKSSRTYSLFPCPYIIVACGLIVYYVKKSFAVSCRLLCLMISHQPILKAFLPSPTIAFEQGRSVHLQRVELLQPFE